MPLSVVVDASFVLAMIVPHPKEAAAQRVYDELSAAAAILIAPTLWLYEVASGIQKLTFFGRISASQAEESLRLAEAFKIVFVTPDYELVRRAIA